MPSYGGGMEIIMKKLSMLLALLLMTALVGCADPSSDHLSKPQDRPPEESSSIGDTEPSAPTPDTYVNWSDDMLCAVRYLGYDAHATSPKELEKWSELTELYPFLDELAEKYYANIGGGEFYLIIPRDPKAEAYVYELEFNETLDITECVYVSRGAFIINCNISDIYSNAKTVMNIYDQLCEFTQWISLKDGSISTDNSKVQIIVPSQAQ